MDVETIHGQIIAKANHYQAVPGKFGAKRIIKDDKLCFQIESEKRIDKYHPRIEFALLEVNEQKQLFY